MYDNVGSTDCPAIYLGTAEPDSIPSLISSVCTSVCVCVCVRERQRERQRERDRDRETERQRERDRDRFLRSSLVKFKNKNKTNQKAVEGIAFH